MRGIAKTGIILVALSLVLLSSFYAYAVTIGTEYDPSTKTVLIKSGGVNVSEIQLVSIKNESVNFEALYRFKPYLSVKLDDSNFNFTKIFSKGNDITNISVFIQVKQNETYMNRTLVCSEFNITHENLSVSAALNCTVSEELLQREVDAWKKLKDLSLTVVANRNYYAKIIATRVMQIGFQMSDVLPIIAGYNLDMFTWWTTNASAKTNVTVESIAGANIADFVFYASRNMSTESKSCIDNVWVNQSENEAMVYELENNTCTANNLSVWWVKTPTLTNGANETYFVYHNFSTPTDQSSPDAVWNSNYRYVFHFGDASATQTNSNSGSLNGTITASAQTDTQGYYGRGIQLYGNSTCNPGCEGLKIVNGWSSTYFDFDNTTVEFWFKQNQTGTGGGLWGIDQPNCAYGVYFGQGGTVNRTRFFIIDAGVTGWDITPTATYNINQWTYLGWTTDGYTLRIWINGVNILNQSATNAHRICRTASDIYVGSGPSGGVRSFNGTMDEFIMQNINRTDADAYFKARYNAQVATFNTISIAPVAPALSGLTILPNPAYVNDTLNISVVINDADDDAATVNFTVRRNGLEAQNYTRTAANGTNITLLSTFSFVHFDNISVSAIANDTSVGGQFNTTNLTISDTAPAVRTISLNLAAAYVDSTLNASLIYTDIDADTGACTLEWHRNGAVANSLTRTALTNATNMTDLYDGTAFVHFDNISFKANCTANNLQSTAGSSSNLTVSDSPPTAASLSFNQSSYNINGPVNASIIVRDIDLDGMNISAKWFRNAASVLNQSFTNVTVANNTNATFSSSFTLTRYDNVSVQINITSNTLSTSFNSSNITIANTAPVINHVNVTVTGLDTATDIRLRINVSDIDGAADIDVCSILSTAAADSNDMCLFNIGDALVNSSIIIWVNDTSAANTSRTIFISMSYAIRTNVLNEAISEGTTHNATIRYNLTVNGQNINETSVESSLPMGNMTNTTVNFFNRTGIFINTSTIQEVNATVLAVNETQTSTCVTVNLLGITRYTCRSYIDVRHQNVDLLNTSYTVSTSLLTSWADRFLNSEDAGVNNITANVSIVIDTSQVNITILDAFALGNGSNEVGVIYDVPIIGEGGAPGGGGGGGSGFVAAVCGNFTYRPSDKITGYGIPGSDIAPFGVYIVNGNTQQGFTISLSKEVQQLCRVEPLSSEILKPNGAIKFTVTCSAPTEKTSGNFNIDSTIPGCSAAIPVELVPTAGVLFGLMEFVRLMAVGEIGSALMVNVFFLPIFLWFMVIAGIILVIWKI